MARIGQFWNQHPYASLFIIGGVVSMILSALDVSGNFSLTGWAFGSVFYFFIASYFILVIYAIDS